MIENTQEKDQQRDVGETGEDELAVPEPAQDGVESRESAVPHRRLCEEHEAGHTERRVQEALMSQQRPAGSRWRGTS